MEWNVNFGENSKIFSTSNLNFRTSNLNQREFCCKNHARFVSKKPLFRGTRLKKLFERDITTVCGLVFRMGFQNTAYISTKETTVLPKSGSRRIQEVHYKTVASLENSCFN